MSAEKLREAARLMRERAEGAGEIGGRGAWTVHETGYTVMDGAGLDVGTMATATEAEHIASWHPAVALAVADWLEWLAPFAGHGDDDSFAVKHGLAVARAYLSEATS